MDGDKAIISKKRITDTRISYNNMYVSNKEMTGVCILFSLLKVTKIGRLNFDPNKTDICVVISE